MFVPLRRLVAALVMTGSALAPGSAGTAVPQKSGLQQDGSVSADRIPADEAVVEEATRGDILELDIAQLLTEIASLRQERVEEAPAVVSVITRHDMQQYGFDSVADALRIVPGFDVLYDLAYYNVGVRGINGGWNAQSKVIKTLVAGQDVSVRTTTGALLGPALIPRLAIRQIDVIRGPLSALYGRNAFLGVVNVAPQSAKTIGNEVDGNAIAQASYLSSWGHHGYSGDVAVWATPVGLDFFAALSLRTTDRSGLALPRSSPRYGDLSLSAESLRTRDDTERVGSAYARLSCATSAMGSVSAQAVLQVVDRVGNFSPLSEPMAGAKLRMRNAVGWLEYERRLAQSLQLRASVALAQGGPTEDERLYDPYRTEAIYVRRHYKSRDYNARVELSNDISDAGLRMTVGGDYSHDNERLPRLFTATAADGVEWASAPRKEKIFANTGVFVQTSWKPTEQWSGIGGLRFENNSVYGRQWSCRAGVVWNPVAEASLKALLGRSFKAPSALMLFGGEHPRLLGPAPNAQLRPQFAHTAELYVGTTILGAVRTGINAYVTRVQDFAELETLAASPKAENRSLIDAVGMELDARVNHRGLDVFVSLSYVHTDVSVDVPAGFKVSKQTRLFPALTARAGMSYDFTAVGLRLFAVGHGTQRRAADKSNLAFMPTGQNAEYYLPAYNLLDVGMDLGTERWLGEGAPRLTVRVRNAFDVRYREPGFGGIDVPGERREVRLSMEALFS